MKNYTCPNCQASFPADECNSRPFAPLDCGVIVECPKCLEEFEPKPLARFSSVWPKLNKQDDIGEYIKQLEAQEFDLCKAEVSETVCLTCDEWYEFTHSLLESRAWLAGKGGCSGRGVRVAVLVVRPGVTPEESLAIYVDPQGYDYARYIGFYITDDQPRLITKPPGLPTLAEAMSTVLNGRTMSDRILYQIPPNTFQVAPAEVCAA